MENGDMEDDKRHCKQQSCSNQQDLCGNPGVGEGLFDWVDVAACCPQARLEAGPQARLEAGSEASELGGSLKGALEVSSIVGGHSPGVLRSYARVERSGTTSGVAVATATRVGDNHYAEIERALRAAEALVADGRERDARRVEGRRQRATRTAERLEEVARMALLRLACGRLGAAWHHWSEAAREARNLRVLAQRTRPSRAAPMPQMRPHLCARPFQPLGIDTDSCGTPS